MTVLLQASMTFDEMVEALPLDEFDIELYSGTYLSDGKPIRFDLNTDNLTEDVVFDTDTDFVAYSNDEESLVIWKGERPTRLGDWMEILQIPKPGYIVSIPED